MMSYKFKLSCLKCSLVAGFMLFLQVAYSQSKFADLEQTVEARRKTLGNDLMVFVANKDTILYQKAFGDMPVRTQAPVGAASAWFTTALVLQLVDEGKISLDDKIIQYLPIYESYAKKYVTIRHCLTHMTGIQAEPFKTASITAKRKYESLEEEVNDYARKEIQTNAGEEFRYSNMGVSIAARIVEVVTKKKFEQLMRQRIFSPLGMRNTVFTTEEGLPGSPSTGARTTAVDFTRFLQMILNGGTLNGKKILSPEAVAEMRKVQMTTDKIKNAPKTMEGFQYTIGGVWAVDAPEQTGATATVLASPGLLGAWPMVDFNRGYVFVVFPKSFTSEQRQNEYLGLKEVLDQLPLSAGKK
ncbi:MAG TPA: serine hydrolase domain-containing protein [Flavisolibacter sp.]|nr:serine hydrolase domain-containing protein [Flavisolibacter sp.]